MSSKVLAEVPSSRVSISSGRVIWFKSKPLRAIGPFALQLETKSSEAVRSGEPNFGFEIVVFANAQETTPYRAWYSHANEFVPTYGNDVWQLGPIFYPDHFLNLKVGNVIGVQIVQHSSGIGSLEVQGTLVTKSLAGLLPLTEDLPGSLRDRPVAADSETKLQDFTLQLLKLVMSYDKEVLKGVLQELEISELSQDKNRTK